MAGIFITGSADGLGLLAAKELVRQGHRVVLHARNEERASKLLKTIQFTSDILTGDLSNIDETLALAAKASATGPFDAIIHNAGVYQVSGNNADGLPVLFVVNSLAPYILTSAIPKPERLIYLSSAMHLSADQSLDKLIFTKESKVPSISYSDTKLHDLLLSKAIARKWKDVYSNALHPGWVPTKMGGKAAPDDLVKGYETQVWLAVSNDAAAKVSGKYFHHKKQSHYLPVADNIEMQEKFLMVCENLTGLKIS